jgi:hypothetical protein
VGWGGAGMPRVDNAFSCCSLKIFPERSEFGGETPRKAKIAH